MSRTIQEINKELIESLQIYIKHLETKKRTEEYILDKMKILISIYENKQSKEIDRKLLTDTEAHIQRARDALERYNESAAAKEADQLFTRIEELKAERQAEAVKAGKWRLESDGSVKEIDTLLVTPQVEPKAQKSPQYQAMPSYEQIMERVNQQPSQETTFKETTLKMNQIVNKEINKNIKQKHDALFKHGMLNKWNKIKEVGEKSGYEFKTGTNSLTLSKESDVITFTPDKATTTSDNPETLRVMLLAFIAANPGGIPLITAPSEAVRKTMEDICRKELSSPVLEEALKYMTVIGPAATPVVKPEEKEVVGKQEEEDQPLTRKHRK